METTILQYIIIHYSIHHAPRDTEANLYGRCKPAHPETRKSSTVHPLTTSHNTKAQKLSKSHSAKALKPLTASNRSTVRRRSARTHGEGALSRDSADQDSDRFSA